MQGLHTPSLSKLVSSKASSSQPKHCPVVSEFSQALGMLRMDSETWKSRLSESPGPAH
jgi:hypothetical protein